MKTTIEKIAALVLAFAVIGHATAVVAQDGCAQLGPEVSFCHGDAQMVPFDAGGEQWYHSPDETLLAWFSVNDAVSDGIGDAQILEAVLKSDAQAMGIAHGDLQIVSPMRAVDFNGHAGMEVYYLAPGGVGSDDPNDRVMGRTIVNLNSSLITMNTLEYGYFPSPGHALAALAMRQAFRIGAQEVVPQSDLAATTGCDALSAGVTLCGIYDLTPSSYEVDNRGVALLSIGDASANVSAATFDDDGPSISEPERFEGQQKIHAYILGEWLASRGTQPSDVAVDMMLRFPTGDGPAQESRNAYAETYFIDDGDGVKTHGMTVFLGRGYYVLVLTNNPGQGASEDHLFMLEEILRGLRLP